MYDNGEPDYIELLDRCIGFATESSEEMTQENAKVYLKALNLMTPDGELLLQKSKDINSIDDTV